MSVGALPTIDRLLGKLQLRGLGTCKENDRAAERHRRAALTGVAAALAKAVSIATGLVTVPLTLSYLGTERFGLWMTISSTVAILGFADFGIGNGFMNAVSRAHGKDDADAIAEYVGSGMVLLGGIALVLTAVFALTYSSLPWQRMFNVSSPAAVREAGPAMAAFFGCFAIGLPLGIVQRLQLGLQEGFRSNLWQLCGSVVGFVGVLLVIHYHGGLPWLVIALAGAPAAAMLLNGILYFHRVRPDFRPRLKLVAVPAMNEIARTGLLFFVLQLAVAVAYSADNVIIAQVLGPDAVARYSVTARLFSLISLVLAMFLGPLWPAYGEAISRGDIVWVKRTLVRSMLGALAIAACGATLLVLFAPALLHLWLHRSIAPPMLLLVGLGLWTVIESVGISLAMFLNGANILKMQVVIASLFASGCLGLKIFLVHRLGLPGVPWATITTYLLLTAVPCSILVPRIIRRLAPAK